MGAKGRGCRLEIMELGSDELALDRVCLLNGSWFPCSSFRDLALIGKAPSEALETDQKEGPRAYFVKRKAQALRHPWTHAGQ